MVYLGENLTIFESHSLKTESLVIDSRVTAVTNAEIDREKKCPKFDGIECDTMMRQWQQVVEIVDDSVSTELSQQRFATICLHSALFQQV